MRRLFRFLTWALTQTIWFCIALVVSAQGVYFAYGAAGAELSYETTIAIIVSTAIVATVASELIAHVVCDKKAKDVTVDDGSEQ